MPAGGSNNWTETELLDQLRRDDRLAFETIYNKYWSKLYISAYKLLRDRQASEDIVQEVLVQLWVKRHKQEIASLNAFLYTAIRYQVFNAIRNGKVRESLFTEVEELFVNNHAENNLLAFDFNRKLDESMAGLPEKCRQIFSLSRKEHLSTKKNTKRLGLSPKTVEN